MQEETYESVYQGLLASPELQALSKFRTYRSLNLTYPDALKYPQFFNNNLLAQGRVIKVVRGRSALIRAFCYQLMKLTFEIEVVGVDYVDIFKSVVFLPALLLEDTDTSPSSGRAHTDRQYKRVLADFVELMAQQSIPNFELTVMEYPIVEEALTRTIEALVARCYEGTVPFQTEELLEWLSRTFQIGMERHGKCYRFDESDVFLYEENPEEFYISYLNEMAEVSDYSESTHRIEPRISQESNTMLAIGKKDRSSPDAHRRSQDLDDYQLIHPSDKYRYSAQIYARRTDDPPNYRKTIDNLQFIKDLAREVDESVHNDKPSDKHSKIGSLLDIMSDRSSKDLSQPYKASEESSSLPLSEEERRTPSERALPPLPLRTSHDSEQLTPQFSTNQYLQEDHYNPFTKKYSELYMGHLYGNHQPPLTSTSDFHAYSQANDYKFDQPPSNYTFHPNDLYSNALHANAHKNVLIDSLEDFQPRPAQEEEDLFYKPKSSKRMEKPAQAQPKGEEDSKGTLYRQFTDTRVLEAMPSMERIKINLIRKKYRGLHRKDLRNLHY